jgi:hypothetical protein
MCEASSDGSKVYAAIPRLAAYAKLSRRHVARLIHGYLDPRTGKRSKGFLERGILTLLAPAGTRFRTAIYQINEEALHLNPRMQPYLDEAAQQQLPGILKPPKIGILETPVTDAAPPSTWTPCPPSPVTVSMDSGHGVHPTLDTVSTDSKAFDSKTINSNAEIRRRALLWAEKNSFAYRAFSRELDAIYGAAIGAHNFNHEAAVIKAAQKAGVPDHIALALEHCGES